MYERGRMETYLRDALEMDILIHDYPGEADTLEGILSLIVDICCTKKPFIRVDGEDRPAEAVKSQFMKLNSEHIRYVLKCLNDNTVRIRDPKPYLITTLYNAPADDGALLPLLGQQRYSVRVGEMKGGIICG